MTQLHNALREHSFFNQREGTREGQKVSPDMIRHTLPTSNLHTALRCGYYDLLLPGAGMEAQRVKWVVQTHTDGKRQRLLKSSFCGTEACVVFIFGGFLVHLLSLRKRDPDFTQENSHDCRIQGSPPCFGKVSVASLWSTCLPGSPTLSPTYSPHDI